MVGGLTRFVQWTFTVCGMCRVDPPGSVRNALQRLVSPVPLEEFVDAALVEVLTPCEMTIWENLNTSGRWFSTGVEVDSSMIAE